MEKPTFIPSGSLSEIEAPKILPTPSTLREEILLVLSRRHSSQLPNLQEVLKKSLTKYDVTGFAVYNELRNMLNQGIIKINNGELNNQSIIQK